MATSIIVNASDVWSYFAENKTDLESKMHQIASNYEYGIEVFITEDDGNPSFVVTADNEQIYEDTACDEDDCRKLALFIYDNYLTDNVVSIICDSDAADDYCAKSVFDTKKDEQEIIDDREIELDDAVYEFISAAVGSGMPSYYDKEFVDALDDMKEHFLEYMARKHGLNVYRPMYLEYEDGESEFEEYPYENMEFDDEDNPLYS